MSFYLVGKNDIAPVRAGSGIVLSDAEMNRRLYEAGVGVNLPMRAPEKRAPEKDGLSDWEALLINAFFHLA